MATEPRISKEQYVKEFKLNLFLLRDYTKKDSYEEFCNRVDKYRSDTVKKLKRYGVKGLTRSRYNNAVQGIAKISHSKYLFYKDPTCGICKKEILSIEEVTIDHILPVSRGGKNELDNKQIAHGDCNVRKSNKIGKKWRNNELQGLL